MKPAIAFLLLAGVAPQPLLAQPVSPVAQEPADVTDPADSADDSEEIVVTGQRPRGSVIGDIAPEAVLNARDIRATGATSIQELLDAVAPQTGSARGRGGEAPVLLLGGRRISGFRELRDIPPEAIERMEILPEEVALKYGYAADQRVVNIVLRPRFRSTSVRVDGGVATAGGYAKGLADATRLMLNEKGRTSINLHAEGNSALGEDERDILLQPLPTRPATIDPRGSRTLLGSARTLRANMTANRTILGDVSGTIVAEAAHDGGRSRFGVPTGTLVVPETSPFADGAGTDPILRGFEELGALTRRTRSDSAHLGGSLNGDAGKWRWSATGNADLVHSVTTSDRGADVGDLNARLAANDPTLDPLGALTAPALLPLDKGVSTRRSAGVDATLNGPLAELPAGRANVTVKAGLDALHLDSDTRRSDIPRSSSLGRGDATASVNVDLPIAKRNGALGAIGTLTFNANAGVEHLSDFGTLTSYGAGANWSPAPRLNFITSYSREEGAPSLNQLGDPILSTPGARVFDFTQGQSVLVTAISGGNPDLAADRRSVVKLGGNWQPFAKTDLRLRADYVRSTLDRPISSFPGATPALEAAFPDRFVRDADGNLVSVDLRPVNYDQARRDTLRIGFDFTKPLKSARPSQSTIDRLRALRAEGRGSGANGDAPAPPRDGTPSDPPPPSGDAGPPPGGGGDRGPGGFGGRGGFGGGGFGGGRNGGRLTFSLTDTISLVNSAVIAPGLPKLDFLHGDAQGNGGGQPRHSVEAQAGYFNNGLGARLSAEYRSGTRVVGGQSGDLRFSPLATVDLRLFANLGQRLDLVAAHPWLRGSSVQLNVNNLLDARQKVRDSRGGVPLTFQPDLIDPLGRTVTISIRKLFLPKRAFGRPRG